MHIQEQFIVWVTDWDTQPIFLKHKEGHFSLSFLHQEEQQIYIRVHCDTNPPKKVKEKEWERKGGGDKREYS